jgi:hypothetical protein
MLLTHKINYLLDDTTDDRPSTSRAVELGLSVQVAPRRAWDPKRGEVRG